MLVMMVTGKHTCCTGDEAMETTKIQSKKGRHERELSGLVYAYSPERETSGWTRWEGLRQRLRISLAGYQPCQPTPVRNYAKSRQNVPVAMTISSTPET